MKIALYFDEDSQDTRLLQALRLRGVDVSSSAEAGRNGESDEGQLEWATTQGRVLFSFNTQDFCRLHKLFITQGRPHAGIVVAAQQEYSIGGLMRRLLRLYEQKLADEMKGRLEFLSDWG